jgi:hypothetical protein
MIPGISRGLGWASAATAPADDDEPASDMVPVVTHVRPSERVMWARWIVRLVAAATEHDAEGSSPPLAYRALIARIMIQLLAHGVPESGDQSWREVLAQLAANLVLGRPTTSPALFANSLQRSLPSAWDCSETACR